MGAAGCTGVCEVTEEGVEEEDEDEDADDGEEDCADAESVDEDGKAAGFKPAESGLNGNGAAAMAAAFFGAAGNSSNPLSLSFCSLLSEPMGRTWSSHHALGCYEFIFKAETNRFESSQLLVSNG